jgi:hypothetical protein
LLLPKTMRVRDFRDPISDIRLPERSLFSSPPKTEHSNTFVSDDNTYNAIHTQTHLVGSAYLIEFHR